MSRRQFREAIDRDAQDLRTLADAVAASSDHLRIGTDLLAGLALCGNDFRDQERQLDAAAWALRRAWLTLAHRPADTTPKSPCAGQIAHVATGDEIDFGYERALDASLLEGRGDSYVQPVRGWSRDLVVCRSGQAALAGLLRVAVGRWGRSQPMTVAHAGAYFETISLLDSYPDRILRRVPTRQGESADLVIAEPVWCNGQFGVLAALPRPRHALLLDITMVGPAHDLAPYLASSPLVVAYSSGLKLEQAGLELANVGLVRILSCDGQGAEIAADLRHIRGLTGSGLTLDELSALSAPWFMDRAYADRYTRAIFDNNRALARAIGTSSPLFEERCHPALLAGPTGQAEAPFCALSLREPSAERYRRLEALVEREAERRGLLLVEGGSFGFRGHRFELIEPEQGPTFLRVALGWRDGHSRQGICDLFAELAATPSFEALERVGTSARKARAKR